MAAQAIDGAIESIGSDDFLATNPRAALASSVATFIERAPHEVTDLNTAISTHQPDALIIDMKSWGALAAAEASGIPWCEFSPSTPAISSRDIPPFGLGLPPARGPFGRLRDVIARPLVIGMLEKKVLPRFNEIRASLDIPPVYSADEAFTRPALMLVTTSEPFEYRRSDWPALVVLVGSLSWEPPVQTPGWLDDISDPLVLVTTSSEYQGDERIVEVALEALASEQVHVVATVPAGIRVDYRVPPNAHVVEFVPHEPVLSRAVCAHPRWNGATQKALASGVPVCVVPWGRDQHEVAQRVVQADCGTTVARKKLTPDKLREAVRAAHAKTDGVARVREGFEAAGGASAAADEIERRLLEPNPGA